ncbi:MAG: response regulator [Gemmatimonadota bacterium]|nr:response regulator [Gemmatimonadota bacterium]
MTGLSDTKVMIVDDEEIIVGAIQSFLEFDTEHSVLPFTSPDRALEALGEHTVHMIVADYMMPEMDGVTFLTRAREVQPQATRVLLTGYADKQNAIRAINEAGLYHYLEKPWDNEALKMIIRNGVERSALFLDLQARMAELAEANAELDDFRERLIHAFL